MTALVRLAQFKYSPPLSNLNIFNQLNTIHLKLWISLNHIDLNPAISTCKYFPIPAISPQKKQPFFQTF